jgi:SH3-like domain-containing protein
MFNFFQKDTLTDLAKGIATDTTSQVIHTATEEKTDIIKVGVVNTAVLNIRQDPTQESQILGTLSHGAIVNIVDDTEGWYKFKFNDGFAYLVKKFVDDLTGVVNSGALNVRSSPDKNAEILGKITKNVQVPILLQMPGWYKISFNGGIAYVVADFINLAYNQVSVDDGSGQGDDLRKFLKDDAYLNSVSVVPAKLVDVPDSPHESMVVAQTYNNFGGLLDKLAAKLNIETAAGIAVLAVESGGQGFGDSGKVLIRFENHLFWRNWGKNNAAVYNQHFRFNATEGWKDHEFRPDANSNWVSFHGNQDMEWQVFNFARSLDEDSALICASYGAPQVLGSNYKMLGYQNAEDLLNNFQRDIRFHVFGLFDFFSDQMCAKLRKKDFAGFAGYYNGQGQEQRYGGFIAASYNAFKNLKI